MLARNLSIFVCLLLATAAFVPFGNADTQLSPPTLTGPSTVACGGSLCVTGYSPNAGIRITAVLVPTIDDPDEVELDGSPYEGDPNDIEVSPCFTVPSGSNYNGREIDVEMVDGQGVHRYLTVTITC